MKEMLYLRKLASMSSSLARRSYSFCSFSFIARNNYQQQSLIYCLGFGPSELIQSSKETPRNSFFNQSQENYFEQHYKGIRQQQCIQIDSDEEFINCVDLQEQQKEQNQLSLTTSKQANHKKMIDHYEELNGFEVTEFLRSTYDKQAVHNIQQGVALSKEKQRKEDIEGRKRQRKVHASLRFINQNKAILQLINKDPTICLNQLVRKLQSDYLITIKKCTLHKRMINFLGYTYSPLIPMERPILSNDDQETLAQRRSFLDKLKKYSYSALYVCGVSRFAGWAKTVSAWMPKNKNSSQIQQLRGRLKPIQEVINMLVTISPQGLVKQDRFTGELSFNLLLMHLRQGFETKRQEKQGKVIVISDSIYKKISGKRNCLFKNEKNSSFYVEKAADENGLKSLSFQENQFIQQIQKSLNVQVIAFPSFSSHLDPSNEFFKAVHKKFRGYKVLNQKIKTSQQLRIALDEVMKLVCQNSYSQYFSKIQSCLQETQSKQQLI